MPNAPYRTQQDMGTEGTVQWLIDWLGEEDFRVERLFVSIPDFAVLTPAEAEELASHSSNRESELHSYLKFAAARWLKEHSRYPETIASEVICYAPIKERSKGRRFFDGLGGEVDIRSPQILYDNSFCFPLSFGKSIRLDLHSFDIAVEVGGTQPVNLLMPLLEGLADQSLWVPYPAGVRPGDFRRDSMGLSSVGAYMLQLKKPPSKRRKRTPETNRRGPHPYPLGGTFAEWYVDQHGANAAERADKQVQIMEMLGDATAVWNWRIVASDVRDMLAKRANDGL